MTSRVLLKAASGLKASSSSSSLLTSSAVAGSFMQTLGHKSVFDADRNGVHKGHFFKNKFKLNVESTPNRIADDVKTSSVEIPTPPPQFNHYNPGQTLFFLMAPRTQMFP